MASPGTAERAALLARQWIQVWRLLDQRGAWGKLGTVTVYVIDLLDPLGYMLGHGLRAHANAPDPDAILRAAHALPRAVRPVAIGVLPSAELAAITERVSTNFAEVTTGLHEPVLPFHVRVLVVTDAGAELVHVPVQRDGTPVGSA